MAETEILAKPHLLSRHFPNWQLTYDLKRILGEIAQTEQKEFGVARESDTLC